MLGVYLCFISSQHPRLLTNFCQKTSAQTKNLIFIRSFQTETLHKILFEQKFSWGLRFTHGPDCRMNAHNSCKDSDEREASGSILPPGWDSWHPPFRTGISTSPAALPPAQRSMV